jgi:acetamidase/formamidase
MVDHVLRATCETVHLGGFSPQLSPVLAIRSGDRVQVETYTGFYVCEQAPPEFAPPELLDIVQNLPKSQQVDVGPHLLTGPIWIDGAEPGDVLEVEIEAIAPRLPMGYNLIRAGWGALPQQFPTPSLRFIPLDLERAIAEFPPGSGIQIPLRPSFGILAVAPLERCSSVPPGRFGGNLDNRHLQAGSRIFLPILQPGALFSIGDGHAAQGDGEVDVTAIETSMNGTVRLTVRKDLGHLDLTTPIAETPADWITMGFGSTLDEAFNQALERMIGFLETFVGLSPEDAYVLCSLGIHFHMTQVVNRPQKGVHGMLPKSLLPRAIAL